MKFIPLDSARIQEMVALWNQELGEDFLMREELFKQNSFNDINVSYTSSQIVLNKKDRVIGFIIAKRLKEDKGVAMDPKRGWIQTLLVDRSYRGKGIGTTLLKHAESALQTHGVEKIQLGGDLFHYFPGVPAQYKNVQQWVEKKNYVKQTNTYDLINVLNKTYHLPKDDSVEFTILKKEEKNELISFLNTNFPGRWVYEAIKYFEMKGDGSEFVVIKKNNRIIGFCRINDSSSPYIAQNVYWSTLFEEEVGGVGPLGIDKKEQKQGYGLKIVQAGMHFLQERDIKTIIIDWTNFLDFYQKLNFKPWKKYIIYFKDLI